MCDYKQRWWNNTSPRQYIASAEFGSGRWKNVWKVAELLYKFMPIGFGCLLRRYISVGNEIHQVAIKIFHWHLFSCNILDICGKIKLSLNFECTIISRDVSFFNAKRHVKHGYYKMLNLSGGVLWSNWSWYPWTSVFAPLHHWVKNF